MTQDARISTGLPGHPKTKKLIRRVGEAGAWKLVCLVLWARQNRPDGDFSGMTDEDIELAIDWTGAPNAFVTALTEVRFLDGDAGSRQFHGWEEHNPYSAGQHDRSEKAKLAALIKHHGEEKGRRMFHAEPAQLLNPASSSEKPAPSMRLAEAEHPPGMKTPAPLPSPSPYPSPLPTADAVASAPATDRATRLPKDWILPIEWEAEAERVKAECGKPWVDVCMEAAKFRDFWVAKPGKDGRKVDWLGTWRNWIRNARQDFSARRQIEAQPDYSGIK